MTKLWYLYIITNLCNNKLYIGVTTNPEKRWWKHCNGSRQIIGKAIKKYGKENFSFTVWYRGPEFQIKIIERKYIKLFNTYISGGRGYNASLGGEGISGCSVSIEARKKISDKAMGHRRCLGHKHSLETRLKMSLSGKGKNLGRVLSDEHKKKIGLAGKGRKQSVEARRKTGQAQLEGKNHRAKPIRINNIEYSCIKEAARLLDIPYGVFRHQIRKYGLTGKWPPGCGYIVKQTT